MKFAFLVWMMLSLQYDAPMAIPPGQYLISLKLRQAIKEGKAFISYYTPKGRYLDSADIVGGKVSFKGNVPDNMTIGKIQVVAHEQQLNTLENTLEVWLESAQIEIEVDKNAIIEYRGTEIQEQFSELQKILLSIRKKEAA